LTTISRHRRRVRGALAKSEDTTQEFSSADSFFLGRLLRFIRERTSVLVVRTVVALLPILAADIAEFVLATTSHMVAPLIILNHHPVLGAPSILQVLFQKLGLVVIASQTHPYGHLSFAG
jgi:hypothetical protein